MVTKQDHAMAFESEIITLLVGEGARKLTAHQGYLVKVPFFAACLETGFKEGEEGIIRLPEDDADAIEKVLEYLYGGNFNHPRPKLLEAVFSEIEEREVRNDWAVLAKCYTTADKYCLEDLQNKIMDFVKENANLTTSICASGIQQLSQAGLRACRMRIFLLKEMAYEVKERRDDQIEDEGEDISNFIRPEVSLLLAGAGYDAEDLLVECVKVMGEHGGGYPSVITSKCDWHVHKDGKKCPQDR